MERIWLKSYPPGVPAEVDLSEYASLADLFERSAVRFRERTAYLSRGTRLSYGELQAAAGRFAAWLQQDVGLAKGARVALMLPNLLQYPVCMFGALRAGGVVVNCNPLSTPHELHHQLADSGAELIVILENFAHVLERAIIGTAVRHVVVTSVGELLARPRGPLIDFMLRHVLRKVPRWHLPGHRRLRDCLAAGAALDFVPLPLTHADLAFLQYTGGTTGVSKGAMLTHGNLLANLLQAHAWVRQALGEEGELIVTALPLYHIFAMTANCFLMLHIGAASLLIANPRDIPALVRELARQRWTIITGVNTLFNALLDEARFRRLDFSRLKIALGGGAAIQRAVAERWQEVTGRPLIEAYGLTETSPAVTINPLALANHNGMVGLPLPSTEVAIRDGQGVDLPLGEIGELCVRGPQVMQAYFGQAEESAAAFFADGFLRTGDLAAMDARGFVRLVDRVKDMIIVSGFNVYPNEIEDIVGLLPGVQECAAVGIPDGKTGEAVALFVVRRQASLRACEVLDVCRKHLTRYKVPTRIEFRDSLPKTNIGKVSRQALRDAVAP